MTACCGSDPDPKRKLWKISIIRSWSSYIQSQLLVFPATTEASRNKFCFNNWNHGYITQTQRVLIMQTFYICMTIRQIKWNDRFSRYSKSRGTDRGLGKHILAKMLWESVSLLRGFQLKKCWAIYNKLNLHFMNIP